MERLMKIAASAALAGVLLIVVGFAMGARPSDSRNWDYGPFTFGGGFFEQNGHGHDDDRDDFDDWFEETAAASNAKPVSSSAAPAASSSAPQTAASSSSSSAAPAPSEPQKSYLYHSLEIETGAAKVIIETGDDFRVTGSGVNWSEKNDEGTLKVETKRPHTGTLTVTVPADFTLRELEVSVGAGSLSMSGISCEEGSFSVGAGEIVLDSVTVTREADFEIGMGSLTFSGTLSGKTKVECGVGSVDINAANPGDYGYDVELAGGSVVIGGESYTGLGQEVQRNPGAAVQYEVECGFGEVNILFV